MSYFLAVRLRMVLPRDPLRLCPRVSNLSAWPKSHRKESLPSSDSNTLSAEGQKEREKNYGAWVTSMTYAYLKGCLIGNRAAVHGQKEKGRGVKKRERWNTKLQVRAVLVAFPFSSSTFLLPFFCTPLVSINSCSSYHPSPSSLSLSLLLFFFFFATTHAPWLPSSG